MVFYFIVCDGTDEYDEYSMKQVYLAQCITVIITKMSPVQTYFVTFKYKYTLGDDCRQLT